MITGYYKIAEKTIKITSLYKDVHWLCREYRVNAHMADIDINIVQEDIEAERIKADEEDKLEGIPGRKYDEGILETTAVYRKLVTALLDSDIILFHGSAVAVDGKAYIFTARSGTGKSTHVGLWKKYLGKKAIIINDDKPLLHISETKVTVFGTPWSGKHNLNTNIAVPLKAVCILERGVDNAIEPCTFSDVFSLLYQQTYKPDDGIGVIKTMELLDTISEQIRFYRLKCNMELDAAVLSWTTMGEDVE